MNLLGEFCADDLLVIAETFGKITYYAEISQKIKYYS